MRVCLTVSDSPSFSSFPNKVKGLRQNRAAPLVHYCLILTLDEALLEHLLIAEPQIGDIG
jgi:hypothetical protein